MDVNALKNHANARKFQAGDVITTIGQKLEEMYIILEGHVRTKSEKQEATLGPAGFFGEYALFLQKPQSLTAVAADDVTVFAVRRDTMGEFFATQQQLTYLIIRTLCSRLESKEASPAPEVKPEPKPEATPEPEAQPPSMPTEISADLFPEGHKAYSVPTKPAAPELIYKKTFKCPVCDKSFQAYSVRNTRLKVEKRDKDFRSHYVGIDTVYYEIITCEHCLFSNFEAAYSQPIVSRLKEYISLITIHRSELGMNLTEDRGINAVFAGYYLALKGAPLFYKSHEMTTAKIWLRLMWLYHDAEDAEMEAFAAKKAHAAYLATFEKSDASPEAIQQMCILMGELSLIVKDLSNAKIFFVKARNYRNGPRAMINMADDGIETIRKIEAGVIKL